MDLNKIVSDEMKKLVDSGKVEEIINKKLEDTVRYLVSNLLEPYSDFGKVLKVKVGEALDMSLVKLDLPSYGQLMCNMIEDQMKNSMFVEAVKKIEDNLKKIFKPLEKTQWKLSEIIEKFIETIDTDDGKCGDITLWVNKGVSSAADDYWDVCFDKYANTEKYSCAYSLRINKNGVWDAVIDSTAAKTMKTTVCYGFNAFMLQLFATGCQIENDEDCIDRRYGRED